MDADLEALLALQAEDDVVDDIAARLAEISPRLAALEAEREAAQRRLNQTQGQLDVEERRRRELEHRLSEHKQKAERSAQQFDLVKRMKEATAVMSQLETAKKMVAEGEVEVREVTERVSGLRRSIDEQAAALAALERHQAETRDSMRAERGTLESDLADARAKRDGVAQRVPANMRAKYERIRSRRNAQALFALASGACSACDTALPLQKRNVMVARQTIDVCEACGVLLYATE